MAEKKHQFAISNQVQSDYSELIPSYRLKNTLQLSNSELAEVQTILREIEKNPKILETAKDILEKFPKMSSAQALAVALMTQNVTTEKNENGTFTHTFR